ncbi:hypothetical protein Y919_02560 [Caloranaerobacter azorensis H53214]|uniref:HK97 gp10 family phage protein n=1 Tax=Caloranaerobacter azorensis H53214 TaxID=1156417 RepID=A0A096BK09_9FIRM|nr:HK97 gp10 family phage protein [Caloranaerobacter azorensis]KGG81068.1 hypothetical protein Y919_02560 [Caloranaerobacter azorensis H53214]
MGFKIDIARALRGLAEAETKMKAAVGVYADSAGKKMEAHAKQNAPWTDRTGQARQTIEGGHEWQGNKCIVYVAGNKEYSPYLEFANEKKYATLYPTVKKMAPEILKGMAGLLNRSR